MDPPPLIQQRTVLVQGDVGVRPGQLACQPQHSLDNTSWLSFSAFSQLHKMIVCVPAPYDGHIQQLSPGDLAVGQTVVLKRSLHYWFADFFPFHFSLLLFFVCFFFFFQKKIWGVFCFLVSRCQSHHQPAMSYRRWIDGILDMEKHRRALIHGAYAALRCEFLENFWPLLPGFKTQNMQK